MPLADARARVPDLASIEHDPAADRRLVQQAAALCDRYTPLVAVDEPDGVTLDITGCTHLHDSEVALVADIVARLAVRGLSVRHAFATTPQGAQALARFGGEGEETAALRRLPIAALRLDEPVETALRRAGLTSIGDLADRPTAPLSARFGAGAALALERLLGRVDSRIVPLRAPPQLFFERRFAEPIARTDAALATIAELLGEAAAALELRHAGGRRFAARLYRSDGETRDLAVATGRPVRDPATVMRLFDERIDTLADPIDPGFGFDMIRLAVPKVEPLAPAQFALEGGGLGEDALAVLVDRLDVRLGRGRVLRFEPRNSHIPEQTCFTFPAAQTRSPASWSTLQSGEPPLRPLHLFDPPQRIEVIAEVPDGPPRHFRWRRTAHEVSLHEGPERIAGEWWRTGRTGRTRDYYRVEDTSGRRFWIFRHGLYGNAGRLPGWYIHGLFA